MSKAIVSVLNEISDLTCNESQHVINDIARNVAGAGESEACGSERPSLPFTTEDLNKAFQVFDKLEECRFIMTELYNKLESSREIQLREVV